MSIRCLLGRHNYVYWLTPKPWRGESVRLYRGCLRCPRCQEITHLLTDLTYKPKAQAVLRFDPPLEP